MVRAACGPGCPDLRRNGRNRYALGHPPGGGNGPNGATDTLHPSGKGEHLYIPAGLVHAIGAGHLIAEIQQNSDTTYRLYDWNRTDASGQGRELHMEQALDSIAEFRELCRQPGYLTEMPHFTTEEYRLDQGERFTQPDASRFAIFTILRGSVSWDGKTARQGEFILSPANADAVTAVEPDTVLLSTTV